MKLLIDIFAGGGGASVGIEMALGRQVDIAINHDPDAILMHETNHQNTKHYCESVWDVEPLDATQGKPVGLLWASPDCKHFSKAKGGKPKDKNIRALPWAIVKWASKVRPDVIIAENVEEITTWGPLDDEGYPIKDKKGQTFKKFIDALRSLGYAVEWKELGAADYGAPTTRKRWYMIARCDGQKIVWPKQTHAKKSSAAVELGILKPWVPVSTVLDLHDVGISIFDRKKPLAENTLKRIARGIEKFVVNEASPFIVPIGYGEHKNQKPRVNSLDEPLGTIVTTTKHNLVTPILIQYHTEQSGKEVRGQKVDEPIMTIDTSPRYALANMVVSSEKVDEAKCHKVTQFLIEYYGQGGAESIDQPLHTIVTKDRFALITIYGKEYVIVDIMMRMLKPCELYRAQGFPADYIIDEDYTGKPYPTTKQVARCGNSVVPIMAQMLVSSNCNHLRVGERIPKMRVITDEVGQFRLV